MAGLKAAVKTLERHGESQDKLQAARAKLEARQAAVAAGTGWPPQALAPLLRKDADPAKQVAGACHDTFRVLYFVCLLWPSLGI